MQAAGKVRSPPFALVWALLAIVALGFMLRLAALTATTGMQWDSASHYLPMTAGLEDVLAGKAHCQMGIRRPELTPIGHPVAVRALMATGLGYRDAGQVLSMVAGLGLLGLVFLLGRLVGGNPVGLGAATLLALDGRFVTASVTVQTELPFLFGVVCVVLLILHPIRLRAPHTLAAGLLLGLLCSLRGVGLTLVPVLPALAWWRYRAGQATRRAVFVCTLATLLASACAWGLAGHLERKNESPAISNQLRLTLFFLDRFEDAYWPDSSGEVLRIVSPETEFTARLSPDVVKAIVWARARSVAWHLLPLLALALGGLYCLEREKRFLGVALIGAGLALVAAPILVLAPASTSRYYLPIVPLFYPLACVAVLRGIGWLTRLRRDRAGRGSSGDPSAPSRERWWPTPLACLILGLLVWPPYSALWQLRLHSRGQSWRAQGDRNAAALARFLPPRTVVGRGPGGLTPHVALAGSYSRQVAGGPTAAAVARYVQANELEWLVYSPEYSSSLETLLGLRVVPVLEFSVQEEPQILGRVLQSPRQE